MTLSTLLIYVGLVALVLTLIVKFVLKRSTDPIMSYVQNFCGALFIFSGYVKAIDPLGTAYKMEQYFDQFEAVFSGTWMKFLAPIFPVLSNYSISFSVVMIVLEIVLGAMLIIGHKPKFTAWAFIILVAFFTALTGFTYLTGYVPSDANFFDFGAWGAYKDTNMKVTDCGCFGDFIKLEPKVSFFKDIFLMVPAIYFVWRSSKMHQLFSHMWRSIITAVVTVGVGFYCLSNFVWDLPVIDFRPFKIGTDIAKQKAIEEEALGSIQILAYKVTNKASKETKEIPYADYLSTFQEYPVEEWDLEQIYSAPTIKPTKISEFDITSLDGYSLESDILHNEKPVLFIVAHKFYADGLQETRVLKDTIYQYDTLRQKNSPVIQIVKNIERIDERTESYTNYEWKEDYGKRYTEVVNPFVDAAKEAGWELIMAVGGAGTDQILDFKEDIGLDIKYGTADDILLKTIIRSNPGIVLIQKGVVIGKWHYKKLPDFNTVQALLTK